MEVLDILMSKLSRSLVKLEDLDVLFYMCVGGSKDIIRKHSLRFNNVQAMTKRQCIGDQGGLWGSARV